MLYDIFLLICDVICSIQASVLLIRFWIQVIQVRPPLPVSKILLQLSDWIVQPINRVLPNIKNYNLASLVGAFLVAILSMALVVKLNILFNLKWLIVFSIIRFIQWILHSFIVLLLIEALLSWINPYTAFALFIRTLNEPLLHLVRKITPSIKNFDLSLLVALILLQVISRIISMFIFFSPT